jgi:predicted ester cyclase
MADAKKVAARWVEAFNAHDESGIRELEAESALFEAPGEVHIKGGEATTQYAMAWLRAFPDSRLTVVNEVVTGDWVAQEFTFKGTHEQTLSTPTGDIPATHKPFAGRGMQIMRVEGDMIVDTRLYFDQVQVMTQLGLMPEQVTTTA